MTPRVAECSEDLGAADSADSAGLIGIGGGIGRDVPAEIGRQGSVGSMEGNRKAKCESRSDPERPKSRRSREGWKRESALPHGRKLAEKSFVRAPKESTEWRRATKRKFGPELGPELRAGNSNGMGYWDGVPGAEGEPEVPRRKRRIGEPEYRPRRIDIDPKQVKVVRERCAGIVGRGREIPMAKRKDLREVKTTQGWCRNRRPRLGREGRGEGKVAKRENGKGWSIGRVDPEQVKAIRGRCAGVIGRGRELPSHNHHRKGVGNANLPHCRARSSVRDQDNEKRWRGQACQNAGIGLGSETTRAGNGRKACGTRQFDEDFGAGSSEGKPRNAREFWRIRGPQNIERSANKLQLGRTMLTESMGLETRRLVERNVNAKSSKVGSEVGSGETGDCSECPEEVESGHEWSGWRKRPREWRMRRAETSEGSDEDPKEPKLPTKPEGAEASDEGLKGPKPPTGIRGRRNFRQRPEGAEASHEPKPRSNCEDGIECKNIRESSDGPNGRSGNMTGGNRQTEGVRKAKMDDGEYRRGGRGGRGNKAKLQRVPNGTRSRWKISEWENEPEGAEQLTAKGRRPELKCTEPESVQLAQSDAQPRNATEIGRSPEPSSEGEDGKATANGGDEPRKIPDASAEAGIGRSEMTNGRLQDEPRKGDERRTEVREAEMEMRGNEPQAKMLKRQFRDAEGRSRGDPKCGDKKMAGERIPDQKAKMNELPEGMDVGD
ncbi:hypothetical protein C8R47DRAFT_1067198 [Mycena vitilis]|nr:hypothetical protein C8R47DRAFT_1067198 [Mycena vitilis]